MGAWDTKLYGNDTACDVRDTYMNLLMEQLSNQEAYNKTFEMYKELMGDEDEEPLFWYALAETQWKIGRLTPDVKHKAIDWIAKDGGAAIWEDSRTGSEPWKKTLRKLEEKLNSPMRTEKRIRKPVPINHNLWELGDVYAYQFHSEQSKEHGTFGKYVLLQKMGEGRYISSFMSDEDALKQPILMRIHIFDKLFDDIPSLEDMRGIRLLPKYKPEEESELSMSTLVESYKKKDYPREYLHHLGNAPIPANKVLYPNTSMFWRYNTGISGIELSVNALLPLWQGIEYEEIEEGVFKTKRP